MKIQRNGKEIELTPKELLAAYREQEELFRLEDAKQHLNDLNEWECKDSHGVIITDHLLEKYLADDIILASILDKYDVIFDCNRAENDMWEDAIKAVVTEEETECINAVKATISDMAKCNSISDEEQIALYGCSQLLHKAAAMIYREDVSALDAVEKVRKDFLLMCFEGRDSHSRPVYSMTDGRLVVDCDDRAWFGNGKLCTKQNNFFDAEPDTPLRELFPEALIGFYPKRVTDRTDMVAVSCGGKKEFMERPEAIKLYTEGTLSCEGSEQSRYASILAQLLEGSPVCSDER